MSTTAPPSTHPYSKTAGEFVYRGVVWNNYTTLDILQKVENFQFHPTDIVLISFPRSGTTVTQEIIWYLTHPQDLHDSAPLPHVDQRFPFLEYNCKAEGLEEEDIAIDVLNSPPVGAGDAPQRRLIKTHCPLFMIRANLERAGCTVVILMRNPKDVCVSMFYFYRGLSLFGPWQGSWEEFVEIFVNGHTKCGSWFDWNQQCVDYVLQPGRATSILLLTYEDLVESMEQKVKEIANHLQLTVAPERVQLLLEKCHFAAMSQNPILNAPDVQTGFRFVRNGKIGDWKHHFNAEQNAKLEAILQTKFNSRGVVTFKFE